jgi:hypothetical protein
VPISTAAERGFLQRENSTSPARRQQALGSLPAPIGVCLGLKMSQFGRGADPSVTLWKRAGVKVTVGSFPAHAGETWPNTAQAPVRVALVQGPASIREALERTISVLR